MAYDATKPVTGGSFVAADMRENYRALKEDGIVAGGIPIGGYLFWSKETAPTGYLECNGASLDRTTYAALYAVIGTLYGTADGTHFNIPDFRGRFPRAWAHGSANDPDRATRTKCALAGSTMTAGDHVGTEQADEFEAHTHSIYKYAGVNNFVPTVQEYSDNNTATIDSNSTGGNETRPINIDIMVCIKY